MRNTNPPKNYLGLTDVERVFDSYNSGHPDRVTVASVFKMATDRGWSYPRNKSLAANQAPIEVFQLTPPVVKSIFELTDGDVHILKEPPAKRNYVFANAVMPSTFNVVAGSGGTLKTMLLMITAASMAVGCNVGDLQIAKGASLLLLGEEDHAEVSRRLSAICAYYKYDATLVTDLVKAFAAAGVDLRLTKNVHGSLCESDLVRNIIELAKQHASSCGESVKLIAIDHARLVMDGNPDAASDVTQLTRVLTRIAQETGAAVFLLAHSPKTVLKQLGKEMSVADVAGSSAFSDNARSGFIMYGMREDDAKVHQISDVDRKKYVKLECAKSNYGQQGSAWWFECVVLDDWQTAVLKPVSLTRLMFSPGQAKQRLRQKLLDLITQKPGPSKRRIRDLAGKDGLLAASEKEVCHTLEALLDEGRLVCRKPTADEASKHRLGKGREVLFVI